MVPQQNGTTMEDGEIAETAPTPDEPTPEQALALDILDRLLTLQQSLDDLSNRMIALESQNERSPEPELSDPERSGRPVVSVGEPDTPEAGPPEDTSIRPDRTHWYFRPIKRFW